MRCIMFRVSLVFVVVMVGCASGADKPTTLPYTQASAVLASLKAASNDPQTFEVTDWGKLAPADVQGNRYALLMVRGKNSKGASQIQRLNLIVKPDGSWFVTGNGWEEGDPIDPVNVRRK